VDSLSNPRCSPPASVFFKGFAPQTVDEESGAISIKLDAAGDAKPEDSCPPEPEEGGAPGWTASSYMDPCC